MQHGYKCSNILVSWSIHTAHDNIQNFDVCEMFRAQCLQCLRQTVGRASKVWGVPSPTPCHYFIPTTPVTCSTSRLMVIGEACDTPLDQESSFYTHKYLWPDPSDPLPVVIQRGSCDGAFESCMYRLNQHLWPVPPGPWHASKGYHQQKWCSSGETWVPMSLVPGMFVLRFWPFRSRWGKNTHCLRHFPKQRVLCHEA